MRMGTYPRIVVGGFLWLSGATILLSALILITPIGLLLRKRTLSLTFTLVALALVLPTSLSITASALSLAILVNIADIFVVRRKLTTTDQSVSKLSLNINSSSQHSKRQKQPKKYWDIFSLWMIGLNGILATSTSLKNYVYPPAPSKLSQPLPDGEDPFERLPDEVLMKIIETASAPTSHGFFKLRLINSRWNANFKSFLGTENQRKTGIFPIERSHLMLSQRQQQEMAYLNQNKSQICNAANQAWRPRIEQAFSKLNSVTQEDSSIGFYIRERALDFLNENIIYQRIILRESIWGFNRSMRMRAYRKAGSHTVDLLEELEFTDLRVAGSVHELNCQQCYLTRWPLHITNLEFEPLRTYFDNLKKIDLSGNRLNGLPRVFEILPDLTFLCVDQNALTDISEPLSGMLYSQDGSSISKEQALELQTPDIGAEQESENPSSGLSM